MPKYVCLFEAKSIQEYILRSGRLRHVVGASELLDSLTPMLVDQVLDALKLVEGQHVRFSRKAGGAAYLFADSEAHCNDFRDLWSIAVQQYAPGLSFSLATGAGANDYEAYKNALLRMGPARNRQPSRLPAGTPVTRYAPRTGEPAYTMDSLLGLQDAATARFGQRDFWQRGCLIKRFADLDAEAWPRNLEYRADDEDGAALFPFLKDNRYLALLHADGNGLGQLLIAMQDHVQAHPESFVALFRDFSDAVRDATIAAARAATTAVLLPARQGVNPDAPDHPGLIPARPIVLGGDDLTILLRADLALPFTRAFLTHFEHETAAAFEALRATRSWAASLLPRALTAGAGIAFVRSSHPFHLAHALAEDLAKTAKSRAKKDLQADSRIPPTLAFHRVTTAGHGDYTAILRDELTTGEPDARIQTTLVTYGIDEHCAALPRLDDLEALVTLLRNEDMARGPARQILTLLGRDHAEAARRYRRWQEVMQRRVPDHFAALKARLEPLCGGLAEDLPVSLGDSPRRTPLGDMATLLAVTQATVATNSPNANTETA